MQYYDDIMNENASQSVQMRKSSLSICDSSRISLRCSVVHMMLQSGFLTFPRWSGPLIAV